MWKFLKSLISRSFAVSQKVEAGEDDIACLAELERDPVVRECIMRAFNTGNVVIGNRDLDGRVTITEYPKLEDWK